MSARNKVVKKFALVLAGLVVLVSIVLWQRHYLLFKVFVSGEPPVFLESSEEHPDSRWYDGYFLIESIDERTFAIGEPLYPQQNFSYLIIGTERAVLFDAGPGYRDIRAAAESLTELPITFIPSHFHFDHLGNQITFDHVAVVDLPYLRDRTKNNRLTLTWDEHLGSIEGVEPPVLSVDEWLEIGGSIQLGERTLRVIYTPGHTNDSISLYDESSGAVFVGDFMYPGPLYAFLPSSSLKDYLSGTENVLREAMPNSSLYAAHRDKPPGIPTLAMSDVEDLQRTLSSIKQGIATGKGVYPRVYRVNERIGLLAEPSWLQSWGD